jgi:BRCT domain type II-containing protein
MTQEVEMKKQLMELEFQYNMQIKGIEVEGVKGREKEKEDRKDERTKIQATQQSELIDQRNNKKPPKNFESSGNDILDGSFGLGDFGPR